MQSDLIFDVGCQLGHDTAFYLHRGFRVVAIDANPKMIEEVQNRFATETEQGRLTTVNTAISDSETEGKLILSASDPGSSSLFADEVTDPAGSVSVKCVPFTSLLEEYGTPYYLKIDIQGADRFCLESLKPGDLPPYISWEAGEDAEECLEHVYGLGYRYFKCIDQSCLRTMSYRFSLPCRIKWKIRDMAGLKPEATRSIGSWDFILGHSSGPFGDEADGKWVSFETMREAWRDFTRAYPTLATWPAWYDFHAKTP